MAECPKCRWINRDDAQKCANCAADLRNPQPQQPYQPPQQTQQTYRPPQQQPTIQGGQGYPQQSYTPQGGQGYQQGQYQFGQQGYGHNSQMAQTVPDNLAWSIVCMVFCCLIPAIVALVKAVEANSKRAAGDYYGAMAAYNESKTWMYWSIGLGIVQQLGGLVWLLLLGFGGMASGFM